VCLFVASLANARCTLCVHSAIIPHQVVRPSVRLSVTLLYRGHIGCVALIVITRIINFTHLSPNVNDSALGKHSKISGGNVESL